MGRFSGATIEGCKPVSHMGIRLSDEDFYCLRPTRGFHDDQNQVFGKHSIPKDTLDLPSKGELEHLAE